MPRSKKTDKFTIGNTPRDFKAFGKRVVGRNAEYDDSKGRITYQDLFNFFRQHGIDPAKVPYGGGSAAIFIP